MIRSILLVIEPYLKTPFRAFGFFASLIMKTKWKEFSEWTYWKYRKLTDSNFSNANGHYKYHYTTLFSLPYSYYKGKTILDIGCGPLGSLEWANNAKRRVGMDTLANKYLKLNENSHTMEYVNAPSEKIPFEDNYFDVVSAINSFDHVENVKQSSKEIKRVLKDGGIFIIFVEINHAPTSCEPHNLSPREIINLFEPELCVDKYFLQKKLIRNALQKNKSEAVEIKNFNIFNTDFKENGYFKAKFICKKN